MMPFLYLSECRIKFYNQTYTFKLLKLFSLFPKNQINCKLVVRHEQESASLQERLQNALSHNKTLQSQLNEMKRKMAESDCKVQCIHSHTVQEEQITEYCHISIPYHLLASMRHFFSVLD